jgi:microcystin-dependent protein
MSVVRPVNNGTPFASGTTFNVIPDAPVFGYASFQSGYPPENSVPIGAGGVPPRRPDTNGILNQLSSHQVFLNAGGRYRYDAALATAIGGYDIGAVIQSNNGLLDYVSTVTANMSNPNTGGAGWQVYVPIPVTSVAGKTGAVTLAVADVSGAAPLANPSFTGNATAPTQAANDNSTKIATTAYADAIKTLLNAALVAQQVPIGTIIINGSSTSSGFNYGTWAITMQGRVPVGLDSGSGIWTNTIGNQFGELSHTLTTAEMPSHTHKVNVGAAIGDAAVTNAAGYLSTQSSNSSGSNFSASSAGTNSNMINSTGGGGAHNNVQPSQVVVYWLRTA